jgi:putative ABC transport system ATP-binding protein
MVLKLNSIRKSYGTNEGKVLVLNDVSLTLFAGETLALRGESGSGKSTLLHIAGALELPDEGHVEIGG